MINIKKFVKNAIIEDNGRGDLFFDVAPKGRFTARVICKSDGILAGVQYARVLARTEKFDCKFLKNDGDVIKVGDIIAVECKWRSKIGFYLDIKDIEKYEGYMNSNLLNRPIKNLFYVFGFGWCGDSPESVYVVPARELYDYDKDTCRITFPIKETEKEKMDRLERFKKKDNRCLLYIK